jgi:hypothetical protein
VKPLDNSNFHQIETGVMSFFTAGTLSVSDNGNSNAVGLSFKHAPRAILHIVDVRFLRWMTAHDARSMMYDKARQTT